MQVDFIIPEWATQVISDLTDMERFAAQGRCKQSAQIQRGFTQRRLF